MMAAGATTQATGAETGRSCLLVCIMCLLLMHDYAGFDTCTWAGMWVVRSMVGEHPALLELVSNSLLCAAGAVQHHGC
jgi:hypothetical protein